MTVRQVLIAPDPRLKARAEPVGRVDTDVRRLMDDMLEAMHAANGIGLAAPQVGVLKRVIVGDVSLGDETPAPFRMADPELLWESSDLLAAEEGCLSLPDQFAEVTRPSRIRVRYRDADDQVCELEADGLLARCIRHEMDHLDGILFVDHVSALKRNIILRKLAKAQKQKAAG